MGQVLLDVVVEARLRFELENHAHDIYDAYHAIHARVVAKSTFFFIEELVQLIRSAHVAARRRHEEQSVAAKPLMGHDVKVSNLWSERFGNGWRLAGAIG